MRDKVFRVKRKIITWEEREVIAKTKDDAVEQIVINPDFNWKKLPDVSYYWDKNRVELIERLGEETNV